jgi:tetratricopeptide (TPR) repeat protein
MSTFQTKIFLTAIILGLTATYTRGSSDEDVFRESVMAGKAAEQRVQWYIFTEIAQAQAEHGRYVEALETAGLVDRNADHLFIELVSIRAKKGDIAGAKNMAAASTAKLKLRAEEAIAIIQATTGDLNGARETSRDLADKSSVLEEIGMRQIRTGDLEGALKTADELEPGVNHDALLFLVAQELDKRGDHRRALEIARRITTPDIEQTMPGMDARPARPMGPMGPCELASYDAKSGRFAEAYKRLEGTNCNCRSVAYIHEEARDAVGAERAMRSCPNPTDVSAGMAELAKRSAARGEVQDALKFADAARVTGAKFEEEYLAPALRDVGRAWAKEGDLTSALEWARSRPDGYQRAMGLLGVAESISPSGSER